MDTTKATWSKPNHGVQHFSCERGKVASSHWLTVESHGDVAILLRWFPGCKFSPMKSRHASVADAKAFGEAWLAEVAA